MMAVSTNLARTRARHEEPVGDDWLLTLSLEAPARALPPTLPFAARGPFSVFFHGQLFDRVELARTLGVRLAEPDAAIVLEAQEQWGDEAVGRLRGRFAVAIVDRGRNRVIVARDPMGLHPLFFTERPRTVHIATTPQRLVDVAGVSRALNLPVLADHLCRRRASATETYFAAVRRLPAGYKAIVSRGDVRLERSWDPLPADDRGEWLTARECDEFDEVLERAITRTLHTKRSAVFLSGGLDSGTIAAVAADESRRRGESLPLALSLGLPDPECDERDLQAAVARELGLAQHALEFPKAIGSQPLLVQALALSRALPSPLSNVWTPPYLALARIGARHGVDTVLSGDGGDEWLAMPAWHAADLLRRGDVAGWYRFTRMWQESEGGESSEIFRALGWRFGLRPLAGQVLSRVAPVHWERRRTGRLLASDPIWVAPDPAIRAEQARRAPAALGAANPEHGFRSADFRVCLDDATTAVQLEEAFYVGQLAGVRFLMPYYDPDLVTLACHMPPAQLNAGGRLRGLQRRRLAARLPQLGFDRQTKVLATSYYRSTLEAGRAAAIAEVGGLTTLAALGVVDRPRAEAVLANTNGSSGLLRFWDLLNLETWARTYVN
jgi:asparagine synthetase B (glutamine-hydrolysing)